MAEQEEDVSSLPLTERFVHKNWKVRKEAYEAAANEFKNAQSEQDPLVREFVQDSGLWKGAVTDSNVAAHQEALNALCQFLDIAGSQGCSRTRSTTIAPLAEKGLTSTKAGTKQNAQNALLLYVELDKADPVIEELLPVLSHKLPKAVAATLSGLTSIYHEFGCKTVEPKPVIKLLPKVFGHADKNVRAEAQNLTVELYRWLREGIKPLFWNDLKPVQQQDLEKLFEKVKDEPTPKPERLLRSQQAKQAAAAAAAPEDGGEDEVGGEEEDGEIDLEPEAVDVFQKIPGDLQDRLASTKWKDRKDVLDELQAALDVPAIQEGPFDDVTRGLAKCILKDANIAVVQVAANCVELLAKGLRNAFTKYRSNVLESMFERFKERKQAVVDAIAAALDAVVAYASLSDYLEATLPFAQHKNPQVKLEYARFLIRTLKTTKEAPSVAEVKSIVDSTGKLLTDSMAPQRDAGAEILGVLLKIMGERIMNSHFEAFDEIKKTKIKEFADAAEVKAKYKVKAAPAPKPAAAPPGKKPVTKKPTTSAPAPKKTAPSPTPAPAAALQPKPTARPTGLSKPGTGLKPPGIKKIAPPSVYAQSPRKSVASPPVDDEAAPMPKLARGLTGRQLSKPSEVEPPRPQPVANNALSDEERLEMEELRAEVERLRSNNDHLHRENSSLQTRIQELEDSNAQLIEDHTRDVLSIKAKETQLVRARSDAESADQMSKSLQREADRLKRELGRTARTTSPSGAEFSNGDHRPELDAYGSHPHGAGLNNRVMSPLPLREGKENLPTDLETDQKSYLRDNMLSPALRSAGGPPRPSARTPNTTSQSPVRSAIIRSTSGDTSGAASGQTSGRSIGLPSSFSAVPPPGSRMQRPSAIGSTTATGSTASGGARGGQESWKRAAEVTQNLKARIELMRQRQQQGAAR